MSEARQAGRFPPRRAEAPSSDRRPSPKSMLGPQAPDHEQRFPNDLARHLRRALETVRENDRHLGDAEAAPPEFVRQFDLKAVAVGVHRIEVERLECAATKAFEA